MSSYPAALLRSPSARSHRALLICLATLALSGCDGPGGEIIPPDVLNISAPASVRVLPGQTIAFEVSAGGGSSAPGLTAQGNGPITVTSQQVPAASNAIGLELTVTANGDAPSSSGAATITLSAVRGAQTATDEITVNIDGYNLVAAPPSLTIEPGSMGSINLAINRVDFTDPVALSVTGLPSETTASFDPMIVSDDLSELTFDATAQSAGSWTVEIRGVSEAMSDRVVMFDLDIEAEMFFALNGVDDTSVAQGASVDVPVSIQRFGGLADAVSLDVTGLPAGLTASLAPNPLTGAAEDATMTFTASAGLAVGTYPLDVVASAPGFSDRTASFDLTVTAAGTANIVLDFSSCSPSDAPGLVIYRDGAGPWTTASNAGADRYSFSVSQDDVAVTLAGSTGSEFYTHVHYLTKDELVADGLLEPCPAGGTKVVNGTATFGTGLARMTLGGITTLSPAAGPFAVTEVPDGQVDLVAYFDDAVATADKVLVVRDLDIVNNGSLAAIDFGTDGLDPATATITVGGLTGGETGFAGVELGTVSPGSMCSVAPMAVDPLAATFTGRGLPSSAMESDDVHVVNVIAAGTDGGRTVRESFGGALSAQTVTLGSDLPTVTVSDISGALNWMRLQAEFTVPAEYDGWVGFTYRDPNAALRASATVFASAAAVAGAASLSPGDLSANIDYNPLQYAPRLGAASYEWTAFAVGFSGGPTLCTPGSRLTTASRSGVF